MEKQVIFRDQQEFQAADPNNLQTYVADSIQHIVSDAISNGLHYTGFDTSKSAGSSTKVDVAAGRLFDGGKVYVSEQVSTLDLFNHLPVTTKKKVAVVVWGQETDTNVEPRDFLVDLAAGTTEPQAVAMQRLRQAVVNVLPGTESADPQPPTVQAGSLAVAMITLDPTGITLIEMQTADKLPNSNDQEQRLQAQETWKEQAEPRIGSIATDLAALANKTANLAERKSIIEISGDVARLKEKLGLPSAYASYDADYFGDLTDTDPAAAGYSALVNNGLLFPHASELLAPLELFNPNDPNVIRSASGLVLPKYTSKVRLRTVGYAGDISLSQYQSQALNYYKFLTNRWNHHYGLTWNMYQQWYSRWYWTYHPTRRFNLGDNYWDDRDVDPYRPDVTPTSVNGSLLAQTILVPNAMWLTQIGLQFTQIGATGDVHAIVCETVGGKPDLNRAVTDVTIPQANLQAYPAETTVAIPPALLDAGKRYALVLITQGDHRVAVVSGNNYTQGTLFNGTDGDYFVADLTKDLMFTFYGAEFSQARTEVDLQSVSLAGGISDLDIVTEQVVPEGTELHYEIQVDGKWYRLDDGVDHLAGAPAIIPLRAVFLGTSDLAPAFTAGIDRLTASKSADAFIHYSAQRTLAAASTNITVEVVAHNYNAANHSLVASLEDAGASTPASLTETFAEEGGATRFRFTFAPSPGLTTYQVKLTGSKNAGTAPFTVTERIDVAQ
jgi:hypothetical protein